MEPCGRIVFREVADPIRDPVTKFGGQPVWLSGPTWPLSRQTGRPMRFIGQVALDPEVFGPIPARIAHLFMTDEEEYIDGTWEADGGENAVVIQPGSFAGPAQELAEGPTIYRMVDRADSPRLAEEPCEFAVECEAHEPAEDEFANQVGGEPVFLQGEEYPPGGPWRLLLQLDSTSIPFSLNFGDSGVGYAFLSEDGMDAKFLWQCC